MRMLKQERLLFLIIKIFRSPFSKIKNKYYSFVFKSAGLIVGKNISIVGSRNIELGQRVIIGNQNWLDAINDGRIIIGNDVSLSQNVHIAAMDMVSIGEGTLIGSDVLITDHNHSFDFDMNEVMPKHRPLKSNGSTILGRNVWLSDNVKILSGVTLGNNVVVAANAVVTKSFPDNVVIGGIPARIISRIK